MSTKTSKGVAWLYSEICALLDIWADQEIQQQLAGRLHNMCVYDKISNRLSDLGIQRTGEQCREKIKKLRRDYKTVIDNNYSSAFARKVLGCYDKVHEVFGKCAILRPSFVIESIVYNEEYEATKNQTINLQPSINQNETAPVKNFTEKTLSSEMQNTTDISNKAIKRKSTSIIKNKRMKKIDNKQCALQEEFVKSQTDLYNKYINIEKNRYNQEILRQREILLSIESQRREEREKEIELFKSLLCLASQSRGKNLNFQ